MAAIIVPVNVGRERHLRAVVGYTAGHSPRSPLRTQCHTQQRQLESSLVPDGGGRYYADLGDKTVAQLANTNNPLLRNSPAAFVACIGGLRLVERGY